MEDILSEKRKGEGKEGIIMINRKIFNNPLVLVAIFFVIFGVGFWAGKNQVVCRICTPENIDFSLFWDAYNKLYQNYISPENINDQKIIYGAISGMTKSLGDPYTEFLSPNQAKTFQQDLTGSFEGIGAEIGIKKDQLTIIAPLKGTPADRAGLKSGDQIIKIDGRNTFDMPIDEAVSIIRGKKGTAVTLTIFREEWNQSKDMTIIRDTIKIESVRWELLASTGEAGGKEKDIAYIHIIQFGQSLNTDFKKAAFEILKSPAKKIVLDLRNNPGGYLEVAKDIAGWFLEKGKTVAIEDFGKNKDRLYYNAEGNGLLAYYPTVVLINKGSASASEILAGALRDNRKVKLVGEKSFGKGSVQEVVNLRDNSSFLKITIAKWLTPNGSSISEVGLTPDIKIDITEEDVKQKKDPQLDKAIEIVKQIK